MKEQPNLTYLQSLAAGDEFFENKLIHIIKEEFPKEQKKYISNRKGKNYAEMAESVHKIKHKIGLLGYKKGYRLAHQYELDLKTEQLELQEEFESIIAAMEKYIRKL